MLEDATSASPDVEWTAEEIEARRHEPMPDLPVQAGIADVEQTPDLFPLDTEEA